MIAGFLPPLFQCRISGAGPDGCMILSRQSGYCSPGKGAAMKVGVSTVLNSNTTDIAGIARKAEEVGFDSFWLPEHPIIPVETTSRYGGTPDGSIPPHTGRHGRPVHRAGDGLGHHHIHQAGHLDMLGAGAQPAGAGQADRGPRPPFGGAFRIRHRSGMAQGRDRNHGGRLRASLDPDPGGQSRS